MQSFTTGARLGDGDVPVRAENTAAPAVPVVFDSPHSGVAYPADFGFACPLTLLRSAEDTFVDDLFGAAPAAGAAFIAALFPRSYIDVNRSLDDIDPLLLDDDWPDPIQPGEKTKLGKGLIWRNLNSGDGIYNRRLTVAEVRHRIDAYYRPYHTMLDAALDQVRARFGSAIHINCHSMPARVVTGRHPKGIAAADFVLGDRDGTSCAPALTHWVAETLRGLGYSVAINEPYKGVELVRRHGRPSEQRHSLQIEINRRLYLTPDFSPSDGYEPLKAHITQLVQQICTHAPDQVARANGG